MKNARKRNVKRRGKEAVSGKFGVGNLEEDASNLMKMSFWEVTT